MQDVVWNKKAMNLHNTRQHAMIGLKYEQQGLSSASR